MKTIQCKRIYEAPAPEDGYRVLIDRLWPRGISKEKAQLDEWQQEIAPSTELRKRFHQGELDFATFSRHYEKELQSKPELLDHLAHKAQAEGLCLLYAAKDEKQNHALVLQSMLQNHLA